MQRARKQLLLATVLIVALLQIIWVPAASAYYHQQSISGDVWQNHEVDYSTGRYMGYYDYVQMQKTDGPALTMGTYTCTGGGYSNGSYFQDGDPTLFQWIGGPDQYTTFCLWSFSHGNDTYDWFSGVLRW